MTLATSHDARGQLGNSAFMLSSSNLSLANQNGGKSVSTSALQAGPSLAAAAANVSVDRWVVVMDLLNESRRKDKESQLAEASGGGSELAAGGGGSSSGKRHSKQLDKFKSAAKSAAAASRHQYMQQQYNSTGMQQLGPSSSSPLSHQYNSAADPAPDSNNNPALLAGDNYLQQQQQMQQQMHLLQPGSGGEAGLHQQQPLLLHHTKSLPVGSKQQQQLVGPMQPQPHALIGRGLVHHIGQLPPGVPMSMVGHEPAHSSSTGAGSPLPANFGQGHQRQPLQQQQQQQQQQPYQQQLLNISSQQIQSTSGEYSTHLNQKTRHANLECMRHRPLFFTGMAWNGF